MTEREGAVDKCGYTSRLSIARVGQGGVGDRAGCFLQLLKDVRDLVRKRREEKRCFESRRAGW